MLKNILWTSFLILSCLNLNSCVTPPDVPICAQIQVNKGGCVKTISGERFFIDDENKFEDKTWWDMKPYVLYVPPSSWKEIRSFIIKTCKKSGQCEKEISNWERTIISIDSLQEKIPTEE